MLVRKEPETAPSCPQCGDAMRLARKLPPVRPLSGLVVHLCGGCGYVRAHREPEPPPPKWLRPQRGTCAGNVYQGLAGFLNRSEDEVRHQASLRGHE
jgi:hypothetical protein